MSFCARFTSRRSDGEVYISLRSVCGGWLHRGYGNSSVFGYALPKAPPECNLALQHKLNDVYFPRKRDAQLSPISNPVVSHFMNQSPGLWFFPLTIAQSLFFSFFFYMDPAVRCSQSKHLSEKHTADTAI